MEDCALKEVQLREVYPRQRERLDSVEPNSRGEKASMRYCNAELVGHLVYVLGRVSVNLRSFLHLIAILDTNLSEWRWVRLTDLPSGGSGMFLYNDALLWFYRSPRQKDLSWEMRKFDLLLEQYSVAQTYGNFPENRSGFAAHFLPEWNYHLVFGGKSVRRPLALNDVHLLDVQSSIWIRPKVTGQRPTPGHRHGTCIHRGALFCFGGRGAYPEVRDGIFILRFHSRKAGTWSKPRVTGDNIGPRSSLSLVSYQGVILLCGGVPRQQDMKLQAYDPVSFTFKQLEHDQLVKSIGYGAAAVPIFGGKSIAFFGGQNQVSYYVRLSLVT